MSLSSRAICAYPAGELWDKCASYNLRWKEAKIFVSDEMFSFGHSGKKNLKFLFILLFS